ncbi:MAG TPA: META domain-containing protein [Aquaticitalea sp.]|nr:META domain-containing protein [Aquaticitalea sp.]HNU58970.1 META domain-containing protein [Aquaticitalea sp.]
MKTIQILLVAIFSLVLASCATTKNDRLYNATWELEYISGPRIAFDGLYPDKKPQITFNKETMRAQGNNSCNGYSANYTLDRNSISFGEPGPTTMMYCGDGEVVFLNMIKKINKYSFDSEGKLNLMLDEIPMMRFRKIR